MHTKKPKTFNSQVYSMVCKRLRLKRREKTVFFRLLGFLIRNDKPFPYSIASMSENTGYAKSSLFECFNILENLRLIERVGYTNQTKFIKGSILNRICTLVQKRMIIELRKSSTLVQKLDESTPTSPVSGYQRTSSSLEHNNKGVFTQEEIQQKTWYERNPQFKVSEEDAYLFET